MAYTNTWTTTSPLGSIQASTLDDEIRKLRLDIHERWKTQFGMSDANAIADPQALQSLTLADLLTAARASFSGNVTVSGILTVGTLSLGSTVGVANYARLGANLGFSTSQALGLSFTLPATGVYEAEWVLIHTNTGTTGNTSFLLAGPTGVVGVFGGMGESLNSSVVKGSGVGGTIVGNQVLINNDGSTFPSFTRLRALLVADGSHSGTVDINASPSAGTTTVLQNSFVKFTKVA